MMAIDFALAVTLVVSFALFLVFAFWIRYNFNDQDKNIDYQVNSFQQCSYCTYIFFDYRNRRVKMCPNCKSLLG